MRLALLCPGRGSYARAELGSLARRAAAAARAAAVLQQLDALRAGKTTLRELDGAERFTARHLAGENAAALIFAAGLMDAACIDARHEIVAAGGNSMGFYTALAVAGALDPESGFALADGMGSFQSGGLIGGQVITPVCNDAWQPDAEQRAAVDAALAQVRREGLSAAHSIRLGGQAVLAGEDAAVKRLLQILPARRIGERDYPFQLLGHSAFHSELMAPTSAQAVARFSGLPWQAPRTTLVDGRGHRFQPRSTDPAALSHYTLVTQVLETFDFTATVRVILREYAPDALVLLGPGDSLGGVVAQVLIEEGWQGIHQRSEFLARQQSSEPLLLSMSRDEQRARVI